ncbi:sacsin N-terminal ATP-binding-like domain-containing protein [Marinactinospora thermotolerans]|uniref:Molecular chaperone, HSP90 family n=1 Tax=Marinactinospora thermotolerans DSM 45154 TaxID=1122192 RepID=A0A1T4MX15_9ACTN|nr:ATP-binding protein [Marinactinospora thermotolerans]SJZ71396.1 hypothetical protein SAMN02745673_01168 [Marinactinospora thermotolerans DSM 45154]
MVQAKVDPFGVAELRRRVLNGWADSPARFREDANAEEDYALGGYRDRVVVELAQNAADAAARAGGRGRLRLALRGAVFAAANTGAPLTAAGVESLSTLRASAKRDPADSATAGRFGVGFSAVAALSDDVTIASRDGAVRWERERALAEVRAALLASGARPGLAAEIERRAGAVPLLRLPFEADAAPPEGYDTEVRLLLRDSDARDRLARQLRETGQALLLALPALAQVEIDLDGAVRVLRADPGPASGQVTVSVRDTSGERVTVWHTLTRTGRFAPELLADRPTEERERSTWALTWAVALDDAGDPVPPPSDVPRVVHAPTPSDAGLHLPALLIASFPLTPDRRRVASGPAADALLGAAVDAYCDLLCQVGPRKAPDLVPLPTLASGEFDARFRALAAERIRDTPFLATVSGDPVRPRDAVVIEGGAELTDVLGDVVANLLPGTYDPRHPGLAALRTRRLGLAELADMLADLERDPEWWARLYAALRGAGAGGADLGELGALAVPLVDGRLVRGPRGLLLPSGEAFASGALDPDSLVPLGLRIVHPRAADPLLLRLGAVEANERAVLTDPSTRAAVEHSLDADEPDGIAHAVLELVSATGFTVDEAPWLAELALRDDEGGYSPAGELLLPDSPLREVFVEDAPFGVVDGELVERHGAEALEAVGVLRSFAVLRAEDVTLADALAAEDDLPLDGLEEWAAEVAERLGDPELPPVVPEFVGVRDLEFVREDRWPRALDLLTAPGPRAAVADPARVLGADGRTVQVPSYTAWWLRTGALIDGRPPTELRLPTADPALRGLYAELPAGIDIGLARALGVRDSLADLLAEPDGPDELLERLADPSLKVSREGLRGIWTALAVVGPDRVTPPEAVRAVRAGALVVVDAEEAVVVDEPDLLPLLADRPVILAPADLAETLADVLDVALAGEEIEGRVTSSGEIRPVPDVVRVFLDTDVLTYLHHEELLVDGVPVEWRRVKGAVHASTSDGLARALAWGAGRWERRHLVSAVLRDPQTVSDLLAEADLDPLPTA